MTTTAFTTPLAGAGLPESPSDAGRAGSEPTFGELLDETLPLIDVIPVYGPPIVLVAGPWLLVALMLAGPFALLFTLVVVLVAAAALVALIGLILAAPFLLVSRLRRHREPHVFPSRRHRRTAERRLMRRGALRSP